MPDQPDRWHVCSNQSDVPSPALLFYPDRIAQNIRRMLDIAGSTERLRPHVKTHKCSALVQMQRELGLEKFKCATLAEAEMLARSGAADILLAFPTVGPAVDRLCRLARSAPLARISTIADSAAGLKLLSDAAERAGCSVGLFLDLDCGMHRTGIAPGPEARALYGQIEKLPGLIARGLHAYDGHIHETDIDARRRLCETDFAPVQKLRLDLESGGQPVPVIVAGGTPTFPIHARRKGVECSPGTTVLWDFGYSDRYPDLPFVHAAVLLSRVVSKPGPDLLCLDLGYKAVASEKPPPRLRFFDAPEAVELLQSEEHLVLQTPRAPHFEVGACLYALPRHVCPTVALHDRAFIVRNSRAEGECPVDARQR